ncbi:MFS transporter [Dongia sp. agr-C8]
MSEPAFRHRDVILLALATAVAMTCSSIMAVTSALVGQMLASDKALATLPLSLQFVATMATMFPAAFLMRRYGRRVGFLVGALSGTIGGAIMFWATLHADFMVFSLGNMVIGIFNAFTAFYRFAAADAASLSFRPKAISLVVAGGVLAALAGPELSKQGYDLLSPYTFAGCFLIVTVLAGATCLFVLPVKFAPVLPKGAAVHARPLREILAQPMALVAMAAGMLGYGLMVFVMTATPLAMKICGFGFDQSASVISAHAVAMFFPSFFTGHVIRWIGELKVMALGAVAYSGTIAFGLHGVSLPHFWIALILLGLGWNGLYVAGTSLLTKCYRPSEAPKIQALNDCLIFTSVALCSLIAGTIEHLAGWSWVLIGAGVPVALIAAALLWGWARQAPAKPALEGA